jgi:SPASM domain peptide maturase of grasp-with-spasm system
MAGLDVPDTLVTNCKSSLQAFKDRHHRIITKCIGDVEVFQYADRNWGLYTREITQEDLDAAPQKFFPLNRKVSIDSAGEIKNCPAMNKRYGNAADTALTNVLAQPEFRTVWDISKDQVETCCDCEFRYICTDCRALLRNPSNPLSKPLRCGYDPYSATWGDTTTSQGD